jgi:Fe-S oxidoreductase/nitrate reductase gamma subunit
MTADTTSVNETPPEETTEKSSSRISRIIGGIPDFFTNVIVQVRVISKAYPGTMHTLILWGMTLQLISTIILLLQYPLFIPIVIEMPRGDAALIYELIMDLAGLAILIGVGMAVYRRATERKKMITTGWEDIYILTLLVVITVLGFITEGLRIFFTQPDWAEWAIIGNLVAEFFKTIELSTDAAWNLHSTMYWLHTLAGLAFAISIPFTKLRHLILGPWNIIIRPRLRRGELPFIADIDEAEVLGASQPAEYTSQFLLSFDACVRCGRCDLVCPAANSGLPLQPRAVVQSIRESAFESMIDTNGDEPTVLEETDAADMGWYCTTCGACMEACPLFINPMGSIYELRRSQALMTGNIPGSMATVLRNFERQNNPWGLPTADRTKWTDGLDIRVLEPGEEVDVLLFVGCAVSYDDRAKKTGRAFIKLLQAAGVDFGILGDAEGCCGETARRMGNEYLFQVFTEQNVETMAEYNFKRIVTQCPHCFNTLKNEYPQLGGDYKVQHHSELLAEIMPKLESSGLQDMGNIVLHDPCYLGRYNDVFDAPRQILDQSGASRVEMEFNRDNSYCCGGGGGQTWMETEADTRINNDRMSQAVAVNADVVATACPYCLLMLEDASRAIGKNEDIKLMDIAELLAENLPD